MPVCHHESLLGEALEASLHKAVSKAVQILLAHLVYDDADHQLGLFGRLLSQYTRRKTAGYKKSKNNTFHIKS
jgi:hypothetical protein